MNELFELPADVEARWINPENRDGAKGGSGTANHGRKGSACYGRLEAGATMDLADYRGSSGVIRHLWTTVENRSPMMLRGLRIDFYWDGSDNPAISVPYGDFFGFGLGKLAPFESVLFSSPEGRNFNSFLPMPFRTGFRIAVTNETRTDVELFWFHVDFTINDPIPDNALYLHAHFTRQSPTTLRRDYEFLPIIRGKGRYLGVNFGVIVDQKQYFRSWWGEGEVKIYVDGDTDYPTLCGTGTEDYVLTAWGQGQFTSAYAGSHFADWEGMHYCFYRYHVPDPIYFRSSIRATIQQIGYWSPEVRKQFAQTGHEYLPAGDTEEPIDFSPGGTPAEGGLFERADDWSSCAYFYLDSPTNDLPKLVPIELRLKGVSPE
jgi:hypothetical protein